MLVLLQVGLWAGRALRFYLEVKELERGPDRVFAGSLDIINFVAGILIWSLLILLALENLGINITALLAGLGVGGVAVALALQNVLGDLFASLSIALDKPFVVGDTLLIDDFSGAVERIGIKTTRLRSDTGEQIIMSNADILKSRVRNFGRASEQRALATIRVPYATPGEKLRSIPELLESIVREQPNARFERCHLKTLGDSCLQFELSYFVQQPKINPLLDLQQAVNFRIIDEFRRLGIEFAYPTQRVLVEAGSASSDVPHRPVRARNSTEHRQRHPAVRQYRCHLASGEAARLPTWTTRACSVRASTITTSPTSRFTPTSMRACAPWGPPGSSRSKPAGGAATRISATARAMPSCSDQRPAACPNRCRSASDAKTRCSFPCSRKAGASIYRTPSQCSPTRRGVSSDLLRTGA